MAEIKVFEYCEANQKKHLAAAVKELEAMGAESISYLPSGKPVAENCFVSISHSKGKCAVCASKNPIGIDIEKITDRDFEKIVRKTFGEKEAEYYLKSKNAQTFYEIWTRKEAYSKISGDGIREIMRATDTFSVDGYEFKTQIQGGFVLTVCEKNKC